MKIVNVCFASDGKAYCTPQRALPSTVPALRIHPAQQIPTPHSHRSLLNINQANGYPKVSKFCRSFNVCFVSAFE